MKNDISDDRIVFKSLSDLCKDTFQHFRDGMTEEALKLFANHNKQETQAHREDMAILYDNVPIIDPLRFKNEFETSLNDDVSFKYLSMSKTYELIYREMVQQFSEIASTDENITKKNAIERIIVLKNMANFKMAIENLGIRGEEYAKTRFVPVPKS